MDTTNDVTPNNLQTLEDVNKNLLRPDELRTIIENHLKRPVIVKNHHLKSLSENTEGFLGVHFILHIDYEETGGRAERRSFFLKLLNGAESVIFEIALSLNAYEKEKFFYEVFLRDLRNHNIDVSFAPEGYFCKPYVIVLEDVKQRGYKNAPRKDFLNLEHCKVALNAVAKFHSSSMRYQKIKGREQGQEFSLKEAYPHLTTEVFFSKTAPKLIQRWINYSLEGLYQLIQIFPEENIRNNFLPDLKAFVDEIQTFYDNVPNYKSVFTHGDLWSNNFMFKYEDNIPIDAVIVDFQIMKIGPPCKDVLNVFYSNMDKKSRDQHSDYLKKYYYECLKKHLPGLNLSVFLPEKEFLQSYEYYKCVLKLQCICDRCVTYIPDVYVTEVLSSGEEDGLRKFLFEERPKAIKTCFERGGIFRDILIEDIVELRDLLQKRKA